MAVKPLLLELTYSRLPPSGFGQAVRGAWFPEGADVEGTVGFVNQGRVKCSARSCFVITNKLSALSIMLCNYITIGRNDTQQM